MAGLLLEMNIKDNAITGIKKLNSELLTLDKTTQKTVKTNATLDKSFIQVGKRVIGLGAAYLTLSKALEGGKAFIETADTATLLESRLNLVTSSTQELTQAQEKLFSISQETRTLLEGTTDLYTRIARSVKDYNVEQTELLSLTRTINQSLIISGGSAESSTAAIVQLGQAFSGNFQAVGQELASIREQAPRVYEALLDGTGKTSAEFKKLAEEGGLSSQIIIEALKSQAYAVNQEFSQITKTVDQSLVQTKNSFVVLVGDINKALGATDSLSNKISGFSESISKNKDEIVQFTRVSSAVIGKTVDGIDLLFTTIQATGIKILSIVNTTFYGALRVITETSLKAAESLEAIGLSSEESVSKIRTLAGYVDRQYNIALNGFSTSTRIARESLEDFGVTIEDRIFALQADEEIAKIDREFAKLGGTVKDVKKTLEDSGVTELEFFNNEKLDEQLNNLYDFKQELENLNKSSAEIQKESLQTRFEDFSGYIDTQSESYRAYADEIIRLDAEIAENQKQKDIEKLESANTFWAGLEAAALNSQDTLSTSFLVGQESFRSFTDNATSSLLEFTETGKLNFKGFAASVIKDIAAMVVKEQVAALTIQGIESAKLAFKSTAEATKAGLIATTASAEIAANTATTSTVLATESVKTSAAATTSAVSSAEGIPFPYNLLAIGATVAALQAVISGGFAEGGYTGNGGKYEPAGTVHKGEYVFTKEQTSKIGVNNLSQIANGYSDGGFVGSPMVSSPMVKSGGVAITIIESSNASANVTQNEDEQGNIDIMVDIIDKRMTSRARSGTSEFMGFLETGTNLQRGRA